MTNLKSFPLVKQAFAEILLDSYGSRKFLTDTEIPPNHLEKFVLAEAGLSLVANKTLAELNLSENTLATLRDNVGAEPTEDAFFIVVLPCDDNDAIVLKDAGATEEQIEAVSFTLSNFFDSDDPTWATFVK